MATWNWLSCIQKPEHQAADWAWLEQLTQANCYFLPLDEKKALVTIGVLG